MAGLASHTYLDVGAQQRQFAQILQARPVGAAMQQRRMRVQSLG